MDALYDEVESLEAILMDDVLIKKNAESGFPEVIETTVYPLVGEDGEQPYVCVTLQVHPTPDYPNQSPNFKLIKPRGLDDSNLEQIRLACKVKLEDSIGYPVVFDLIEVVREHLTSSNLPSGQCVVCLYGFKEGDEFTRTDCYHYLHSYCLNRHINALRKNYNEEFEKLPSWIQKTADPFQALCPVCREPIKDDTDCLKCAMPPSELQNAPDFVLTDELRELQQRMSQLFMEQKNRGAIIDVEADTAAVISIETEEDLRKRTQKKLLETKDTSSAEVDNKPNDRSVLDLTAEENGSGPSTSSESKVPKAQSGVGGGSGGVCFSPVVEVNQSRNVPDPSNNNYNHHRRHRGGRREHHRNYRQRNERERDRHHHHHRENNDSSAPADSQMPSTSSNAKPKNQSQQTGSHCR